jgi:hypothetical protein
MWYFYIMLAVIIGGLFLYQQTVKKKKKERIKKYDQRIQAFNEKYNLLLAEKPEDFTKSYMDLLIKRYPLNGFDRYREKLLVNEVYQLEKPFLQLLENCKNRKMNDSVFTLYEAKCMAVVRRNQGDMNFAAMFYVIAYELFSKLILDNRKLEVNENDTLKIYLDQLNKALNETIAKSVSS